MDIDFNEIKILGLEEEMTVESPIRPPLRYIYLRLSATPPPIWVTYFDESRKVSRHPHWRRAWIDRKFIVVECPPEELEKYHLADFKRDLAQANQRTVAYFEKQNFVERQKQQNDLQVLNRLKEMKGRLNFD